MKRPTKHRIARLVLTSKQYNKNGALNLSKLYKLLALLSKDINQYEFDFLITPGGLLQFEFPSMERKDLSIKELEEDLPNNFPNEAKGAINDFIHSIDKGTFIKLQNSIRYISLGIDGKNDYNKKHVELVVLYDLQKKAIKHWTGKFYPTEKQESKLVKFINPESHFVRINKKNIVIIGCHDLNVFNPRGQASLSHDSDKAKASKKFVQSCRKYKPDIILHHPHTTDTPNTWNLSWKEVEKRLPSVQYYASGIKYYNSNGSPRSSLQKVLEKTKKGDVIDFYY
ncbi:MAG: hypothetical protein JNK20_16340 [Flavipsychrobacter sp.]|nr:hypothetical protein [Flavipsychrobacter sp.]